MRTVSTPLLNLINGSSAFLMCDLLEIALANGTTLRLAGGDRPVVYGGNTYGTSIGFERTDTQISAKLEVATLDVTLKHDGSATIGSAPLPRAVADGAFDLARVTLLRAFFSSDGLLVDALKLFAGNVAGVDPGALRIRLMVKSDLERLNLKAPAMPYQPACSLTVYGPACGLARSTYNAATTWTDQGMVGAGATPSLLPWTNGGNLGNQLKGSVGFASPWLLYQAQMAASAVVAPDGTATATRIEDGSTVNNLHTVYQSLTGLGAGTYTLSAYCKAAAYSRVWLCFNSAGSGGGAIFDLATGQVVSTNNGGSGYIEPVGNGWYRCAVTVTTTPVSASVALVNGAGATSYVGVVGQGIVAWAPQLVAGAQPGVYVPTTGSAIAGVARPAGFFTLGVAVMVTGANAGLRRSVALDGAGSLALSVPLPQAPAQGDRLLVSAGCDRTLALCTSRFANQGRFRGFPYVPRPEDAR